ncbi:MAG: hypothetical protein AABW99_02000 [archaeon]
MNLISEPEKVKELIAATSGRSVSEVAEMIEAKKQKFSGLLTDSGAAFMIAKELGVELGKNAPAEHTKIGALKEGMANIDIVCRLKQGFAPKEFEKNGRKGKRQNIIISDSSGEIGATLWNNDIEKFLELGIEKGEGLKLGNCSVTSYKGTLQLNMNYNSSIEKHMENGAEEAKPKTTGITDLDIGMDNVDVRVKIRKMFPAKEFESAKGKGKVMNFIIAEGVNEIRATAWNEMVDEVEKFGEGDNVKIEGAYTKEGMNGIELHLGWMARILKDSKAENN